VDTPKHLVPTIPSEHVALQPQTGNHPGPYGHWADLGVCQSTLPPRLTALDAAEESHPAKCLRQHRHDRSYCVFFNDVGVQESGSIQRRYPGI